MTIEQACMHNPMRRRLVGLMLAVLFSAGYFCHAASEECLGDLAGAYPHEASEDCLHVANESDAATPPSQVVQSPVVVLKISMTAPSFQSVQNQPRRLGIGDPSGPSLHVKITSVRLLI